MAHATESLELRASLNEGSNSASIEEFKIYLKLRRVGSESVALATQIVRVSFSQWMRIVRLFGPKFW